MRKAYNTLIQLDRLGKQNWVSHVKFNFSIAGKHKKYIVPNRLKKMWKMILKPFLPVNGNMTFLFYILNYVSSMYFHIKTYLLLLKNVKEVSTLARFRLSSHSLQIELGRHNNTPINKRLFTRCDYNAVDDEEHFFNPLYLFY